MGISFLEIWGADLKSDVFSLYVDISNDRGRIASSFQHILEKFLNRITGTLHFVVLAQQNDMIQEELKYLNYLMFFSSLHQIFLILEHPTSSSSMISHAINLASLSLSIWSHHSQWCANFPDLPMKFASQLLRLLKWF